MIVVKIELWPGGNENHPLKAEIGRMYIANVGGTHDRGDYSVAVCRRSSTHVPLPLCGPGGPKAIRTGEVLNYPRLAYNVWRLIARALKSAFPEEAGKFDAAADRAEEATDLNSLSLQSKTGRGVQGVE
jgi:hypothetical protein